MTPRTVVRLPVSHAVFDEIATKLKAAGYNHAFMPGGQIDMHEIALEALPQTGTLMNTSQTPDPRMPDEVRKIIAELRERADVCNMLKNDNVDYKLNIDLRDFLNRLADHGAQLLADAERKNAAAVHPSTHF